MHKTIEEGLEAYKEVVRRIQMLLRASQPEMEGVRLLNLKLDGMAEALGLTEEERHKIYDELEQQHSKEASK